MPALNVTGVGSPALRVEIFDRRQSGAPALNVTGVGSPALRVTRASLIADNLGHQLSMLQG